MQSLSVINCIITHKVLALASTTASTCPSSSFVCTNNHTNIDSHLLTQSSLWVQRTHIYRARSTVLPDARPDRWCVGELVSGQLILSFTLNAHWVVYENRFLANIFSFNEAFSHEIFLLCAPWRLLLLLDTMKLQINSSSARTLASNTNVHRVAAQRRQFVQCKLGKRAESKSQKHFLWKHSHSLTPLPGFRICVCVLFAVCYPQIRYEWSRFILWYPLNPALRSSQATLAALCSFRSLRQLSATIYFIFICFLFVFTGFTPTNALRSVCCVLFVSFLRGLVETFHHLWFGIYFSYFHPQLLQFYFTFVFSRNCCL